jgi:general secretion pathway protein G
MIELVFVIVVIGILSAIAIPRFAATRDDAVLVKGKSEVAAIRSGIVMQKSKALLQGDNTGLYNSKFLLTKLDNAALATDGKKLFWFGDGNESNVLENPIYSENSNGHWVKESNTTYVLHLNGEDGNFTYNPASGSFDCNHTIQNCKDLTE